jgi:hypothetical protein
MRHNRSFAGITCSHWVRSDHTHSKTQRTLDDKRAGVIKRGKFNKGKTLDSCWAYHCRFPNFSGRAPSPPPSFTAYTNQT